jgi:hypothetical protein
MCLNKERDTVKINEISQFYSNVRVQVLTSITDKPGMEKSVLMFCVAMMASYAICVCVRLLDDCQKSSAHVKYVLMQKLIENTLKLMSGVFSSIFVLQFFFRAISMPSRETIIILASRV